MSPMRTKMEDKFQRSQKNIDRKMKEDFERLQKQLKVRSEKEKAVETNAQYALEEKLHKINLLNKRAEDACDKVKREKRKLEIKAVKEYRKDLKVMEERKQKE